MNEADRLRATIKHMLKQSLSVNVRHRHDGASMEDGVKIELCFDGEEIAKFYLWEAENAGFTRADADFFDEVRQRANELKTEGRG